MRDFSKKVSELAHEKQGQAKPPLIRQINQIAHPTSIRLWLWELPFEVSQKVLDVVRNPKPEYFRYCPNAWVVELRKMIASDYWNFDENNVVITTWVQEAMYITLWVLASLWAKKVMIPETFFWIYKSIPDEFNLEVWTYPIWDVYCLDRDWFENAISAFKPDIVIFNSPQNPTWYVLSEEELEIVSKLMGENWNPIAIADDIYSKLAFGKKHNRLHDAYKNTVTLDWISKSWAAAWLRVWWIFSRNPELVWLFMAKWTIIKSSPATLNQYAALPIVSWETDEDIFEYNLKLRANFKILKDIFNEAWIEIQESLWWFYSFIDVSKFCWKDSEEFCRLAAKTINWVVVIPWKAFWKPTHIRVSFASKEISTWAHRLLDFLYLFRDSRLHN